MTAFSRRLATAYRRHRAFVSTRREIRHLPIDAQLDLGLYSGDADRIARSAVYGA